jgi:hypothetical protein
VKPTEPAALSASLPLRRLATYLCLRQMPRKRAAFIAA